MCLFKLFKKKENKEDFSKQIEEALKNSREETNKSYEKMMDVLKSTWEKKTILIYDLSELPKGMKIEEIQKKLREEGTLLVESGKNEKIKSYIVNY